MSIHSILLGLLIYFVTSPLLTATGFDLSGGLFYPRQSGVFLVILGVGYGLAAANPERRALVFLTVLSKGLAVLFLFTEVLLRGAPPIMLLAGVGDMVLGGVALALALVFYRGARGRQADELPGAA